MPDKNEQRVLDDIEEFGWHLIGVNEDDRPGFAYSVGMMQTLDHPEVIMFGLDLDLMAQVINGMGEQIRAGRRFDELGLFEDLLEGYACKVIPVSEEHHPEYLGYAMWHRRHLGQIGTLRALQCVWPDMQGRFPDDPLCDRHVIALQPLLGQSAADSPASS